MASRRKSTVRYWQPKTTDAPSAKVSDPTVSTLTTTTSSRSRRAFAAVSEAFYADNVIGDYYLRLSVALLMLKQRFNTWRTRQLKEF